MSEKIQLPLVTTKRVSRLFVMLTAGLLAGATLSTEPANAGTARPLSWNAPALTSPTVVKVTDWNRSLRLDNNRDYRVVMPKTPVAGGLIISGGRNVVLVGGEINVQSRHPGRGLYLKAQTGVVHIEGLTISGNLAEGINLDQRLGATVQLQNIRIDTVKGSHHGNHADVIQTWGGPKTLRIDGLRARTTYQGMFLIPNQYDGRLQLSQWQFRNIEISGSATAAYGFWKQNNLNISSSNVFWSRDNGDTYKAFWPGQAAWPGVSYGKPNFDVLGGNPGVNYVTPSASSASAEAVTAAKIGPSSDHLASVGSVKRIATSSGLVLDVGNMSRNDGAAVVQWNDWKGANQRWHLQPVANLSGRYVVKNVNSGKCLKGFSSGLVSQWTCDGSQSQQWIMKASGQTTMINSATKLALDVPGNRGTPGARLQQWKPNGTTAQVFGVS